MRALILLCLLALTGCGSAPVFLGGADDGATFIARLTAFRAGVDPMLGAVVDGNGCQLSMRGEVPRGTVATLHAGECRADLTDPAEFEREP